MTCRFTDRAARLTPESVADWFAHLSPEETHTGMTSDTHTESYERSPFVDLRHSPARPKTGCPERARREIKGKKAKRKKRKQPKRKSERDAREERTAGVKNYRVDRNTRMQKAAAWPRAKRRRARVFIALLKGSKRPRHARKY